jgi:signal transduction histidine kinase/FixJ family two-component response regulator
MRHPISVLLVSDAPEDVEHIRQALGRGDSVVQTVVHLHRVDTLSTLQSALSAQTWDVIIASCQSASLDGMHALEAVLGRGLDTPFVIVSEPVGEDVVVAHIRAGAHDFLFRDHLSRLSLVLERELGELRRRPHLHRDPPAAPAPTPAPTPTPTPALDAHESLALFKRAVDHMPVGVIIVVWEDPPDLGSFRFDYQNHVSRSAMGGDAVPCIVGMHTRDLPFLIDGGFAAAYAAAIQTGELQQLPPLQYGKGPLPDAIFEVKVAKLDEGRALVLFENVRERVRGEHRLRVVQRLEAVGRLAGGVAHDYNNILTVILTYGRFLRESFEPGDPAREDVDAIVEAAERATRLTGQLLAFSRRQIQATVVVNINDTVAQITQMLERLIGEDVALVSELAPDLDAVKVDPSQLEQILMNLAVNSRDAMPQGGDLTIETQNVELTDCYGAGKDAVVPPGTYVMLAVTDTGVGMNAETQSQIFEPFFTTKDVDKGTGLGLPTVYGIVKQSGGFVWVYSEVGVGTTVKVYLPVAAEEAPVVEAVPPPSESPRGNETVLVVEDETFVRDALVRMLTRQGYAVLQARDGTEALQVCQHHPREIALVVTDVVMPGVSGPKLAEALQQTRPGLPVLFMSGYPDHAVARHNVLEPSVAFIQKPFSSEQMLGRVREVLGTAGRRPGSPAINLSA